jgi:hypothetical protein
MSEPTPLTPMPLQVKMAFKWLDDIASIGNPDAQMIHRILQGTLLENSRIKMALMGGLAPLLQTTVGKSVPKLDILNALRPISDLLGGPAQPAAGPAPSPDSPLVL